MITKARNGDRAALAALYFNENDIEERESDESESEVDSSEGSDDEDEWETESDWEFDNVVGGKGK